MSSITLMIFEMLSEESLISRIAFIISLIWSLPLCTLSKACSTNSAALDASWAFSLVLPATSLIEAVISSIALACSVDPCANASDAFATSEELVDTCMAASVI